MLPEELLTPYCGFVSGRYWFDGILYAMAVRAAGMREELLLYAIIRGGGVCEEGGSRSSRVHARRSSVSFRSLLRFWDTMLRRCGTYE